MERLWYLWFAAVVNGMSLVFMDLTVFKGILNFEAILQLGRILLLEGIIEFKRYPIEYVWKFQIYSTSLFNISNSTYGT